MPHADPHVHPTGASTRRLGWVLALTAAYTFAEIVGGLWTGSLALLADAGHMATDDVALGLALFAARLSIRPPDSARTYGFQRAEILAALANGAGLLVVCGMIAWEAVDRFRSPATVLAAPMAAIATGGLVVNLLGAWILHRHREGINVRAAFLHLAGDLLGSVGALAAAGAMLAFGWWWADPAASLLIAGLLAWGSIRLVREATRVLMEAAPSGIDSEAVRACLLATAGVADVHDLHLWSLREGTPILTAHLVVDHSVAAPRVLRDASERVRSAFGIGHATLQVEPPDYNIVEAPDTAAPTGRTSPPGRAADPSPS